MNTITTECNHTKFNFLAKICCQQYECMFATVFCNHSSCTSNTSVYSCVYTTPWNFENAALFLRLNLPSPRTRHENRAFRKRSSDCRNVKTPVFRFRVEEDILTIERLEDDGLTIIITVTSLPLWLCFQTQIQNGRWFAALSSFSVVLWTENIRCVFRVKPPFSNSCGVEWTAS